MNLSGPKRDLEIASNEINKMKITSDFNEFQESWENFLLRIERAWEFTERNLKNVKGFQQWHRPYSTLRKKDPLLIFLKQARNAEMHRTSPTVSKPLEMVMKDRSGRGFLLDSISSKLENGTLSINLESPDILFNIEAHIVPTDPEIIKFKNRGKWYNLPWHHLKERIIDLHPVAIAEMGLTFYKSYIIDAEIWLEKT
jgi:hypothetical protein